MYQVYSKNKTCYNTDWEVRWSRKGSLRWHLSWNLSDKKKPTLWKSGEELSMQLEELGPREGKGALCQPSREEAGTAEAEWGRGSVIWDAAGEAAGRGQTTRALQATGRSLDFTLNVTELHQEGSKAIFSGCCVENRQQASRVEGRQVMKHPLVWASGWIAGFTNVRAQFTAYVMRRH